MSLQKRRRTQSLIGRRFIKPGAHEPTCEQLPVASGEWGEMTSIRLVPLVFALHLLNLVAQKRGTNANESIILGDPTNKQTKMQSAQFLEHGSALLHQSPLCPEQLLTFSGLPFLRNLGQCRRKRVGHRGHVMEPEVWYGSLDSPCACASANLHLSHTAG